MKRLITLWSNSSFSSFHVAQSNGRVTGTVTLCALDGLSHYSVFSFSLVRDWENRVITWLINMWCCTIGEPVPLGLCCDALSQLSGLIRSSTGVSSLEVKSLVLSDVSRTIVDVSGQVLGGTDIHVVLNHLQKRLKGFAKESLLLGCPHLLQVRTVLGCFIGFRDQTVDILCLCCFVLDFDAI